MRIGYASVSTNEQNLDLQRGALKKAGCEKIIEDTITGKTESRAGLDRAMELLRDGLQLYQDREGSERRARVPGVTASNAV